MPTDRLIAPPAPLDADPLAILMAPAEIVLSPVATVMVPEFTEAPVARETSPLSIRLLESADCMVISPEVESVAPPLRIVTAPPTLFADNPAVNDIALPAPTPLVPTDRLIAPPTPLAEAPVLIAILPESVLLTPVEIDPAPELALAWVELVVSPVRMVMPPVCVLAATLAAVSIDTAPDD